MNIMPLAMVVHEGTCTVFYHAGMTVWPNLDYLSTFLMAMVPLDNGYIISYINKVWSLRLLVWF